jgi:hypothetical protein
MLLQGTVVFGVVVAIHVIAAVALFAFLVGYPLLALAAERKDRRTVPARHRLRVTVGRGLVNPGLLVVLAAGIYLAADHHLWKRFYVQWGIGAVIVLGGLEGALAIRHAKQLAELSQRDVAAAAGEVAWSQEYVAARGRAGLIDAIMAFVVIATIVVMSVQ